MKEENIIFEDFIINKSLRRKTKKHHSFILWFTGFPCSGKSTVSKLIEEALYDLNLNTYSLDGDNIRKGLNKNLGFSSQDRSENIRRISEVAKLFVDAGIIVNVSFISPYRNDRNFARSIVEKDEFIEIFVNSPLEICEQRDLKGLYKKARDGHIKGFTGIDDIYEKPINPEIILNTHQETIEESVNKVISYLKEIKYI